MAKERPTSTVSSQCRLYGDLAYLWPIISPPQEYEEEAKYWRRALWDRLGTERHHLLELGVGGGHNLSHLTNDFQATAVDVSPQMLGLSMKLNPTVEHLLGDMRSVRLGRIFDAVLIHDAVSYMITEGDLRATFTTAKVHLRPDGALLIAPDWLLETFSGPRLFRWVRKQGQLRVTIQEHLHDPDPTDTEIESDFSYMIRENGSLRVERDTHTTGLFSTKTWTRLMEETGFDVSISELPANRGRYGGLLFSGVLRK